MTITYDEARSYFSQAEHTRGIRPGLSRMWQLMELLGNPQERVRGVIHVAGTNGKGSVLAFLDEILRRAGYRVAKYTSPAVFTWLERYVVDGEPISEVRFAGAAEHVIGAANLMAERDGDPPTAFEMETATAFVVAAEADCDFFLLETGMGGRLDATNILRRVTLSVITSVSMDHMAFLGDSLEEIAGEKAGIIKDACPVVVSASNFTDPEEAGQRKVSADTARFEAIPRLTVPGKNRKVSAGEVFEQAAAAHRAPLSRGDDSVPYSLSLAGTYQQENAGVVTAAVRVLRENGYDIPEACVREGFAHTVWPGRFEVARRDPLSVLDGAHNADAAMKLAETLSKPGFGERRKYVVLGVFKDKEYGKVVSQIVPLAEETFVFTLPSARGLSADKLADCARGYTDRPVHICRSAEAAVRAAYRKAEKDSGAMVLCCGSLSYLGEAKQILMMPEPGRTELRDVNTV